MPNQLLRQLKPEDEELARKREELATIRADLADRELELADCRQQLNAFQGRYLRQVGTLYAELDGLNSRIRLLQAERNPSPVADARAEEARQQAHRTYQEAHGSASEAREFAPSPELKALFREAAKRIHPDLARDSVDQERRTRCMAEANRAYQAGDAEGLKRILVEFEDGADSVHGEGTGAELVRAIRQISQARNRLAAIEAELAALQTSEIGLLRKDAESAERNGRDLLAELANTVRQQIEVARKELERLSVQGQDSK